MYEMIEPIDQIFASIELSRSIFDALIGAVIGGFFTWLAAYYTMEKQRKLQEEQSWAEHMPLLRIEVRKMLPEACDFSVLGVLDGAWIYRCAESACPVFWKSPVRKGEIIVPDR